MVKFKWITIGTILLSLFLIGCNNGSADNEEVNTNPIEKEETESKRTDFGDSFIEQDEYVAYIKSDYDLYLYNHETAEDFLVHEDVGEFDVMNEYIIFIANDGMTSELDIPLQAIYRTHINSQETEIMAEPQEVDDAYTTPRAFSISDNGYVAIKTEVGFFYSNFWHDYTVTNMNFSNERPIITLEDEYDTVVNEIQWQGNELFLLVDRVGQESEDGNLHTELHSFSMEDGPKRMQEKVLPLSSEEYRELHEYVVYIRVENNILYISAVDDDDEEKIAYEIDLQSHDIIHKVTND